MYGLCNIAMHQGAFMGANWTVRRKLSVAPTTRLRQYQPQSQWNVQVVRGKVTTRCLWNACKALTLGLILMMLGCAMATIGYYADQLSVGQEVRGNSTVRVKNESRGFHLNNLSYAGPIVMGVGGFIVVAACVMTFEARDSAAKVVPARFKFNNNQKLSPVPSKHTPLPPSRADSGRRTTSSQTKWDNHLGLFRVPSNTQHSPSGSDTLGRHALTAAFVQFSRALHQRQISVESSNSHKRLGSQPMVTGITKSPSAPNLPLETGTGSPQPSPAAKPQSHLSPKVRPKPSSHTLHPMGGGCALLSPFLLQRQALSMDNPAYSGCYSPPLLLHRQASGRSAHSGGSHESLELGASAGASGSQTSMAMDLHLPNDCPVTLRVTDQSRRSETARRHLFVRQRPVEEDEASGEHRSPHSCSPRLSGYISRSNTNDSNVTYPRSRSNTGESRYHYYSRRDSLTRGISYMRSSTDESRMAHPRSRANTGESQRYQYRKDSVSRGSAKLYHSRSMADDSRHRRESLAGEFNRRRRESLTKPYYPRSNGDECKYHSLSPHSYDSRSPVSISRSNTDESSHRQDSSVHEYELAYVRTSNEDFTPQDFKDTGNSRTASPSNVDQTDLSNINDVILEKDTPTDSIENGSLDHPEDLIKDTVRSETVIVELSDTDN
ncbi:uncharacterized protein [Anabrus simplex]|uniref:uncharacterized protein n=1 Tax=Anabrus simplex TaxID=316456 RepID=UPI0035A3806D